ncbi:hypothetical protein B0T26DRAFT_754490 [Lasiosphaeria miniovina]|uniref:Uncharacterized protein n=1 Tax=Lasiosphaeria miniovina TaxID=1954250 RepID=A0AA40A4M8_9PEZI|nr:uncharacterized protein B0T26DRAFT_754490 [Lasiosphaeria miniovina]KAK0709253.1 hypothetical protein B0T26DRAFT_754490 [Lasiosphaeria miniovina]
MAPINGAAAKSAKTSTRRATSKTVVPVLPLTYPQRPPSKQHVPAPPALPPPTHSEPTQHPADVKVEGRKSDQEQEHHARHELPATSPVELGPSPAENINTYTPSAAPVQVAIAAELPAPGATTDVKPSDTPTSFSPSIDQDINSPRHPRLFGPSDVGSTCSSATGRAADTLNTTTQHPIMHPPGFHHAHPSNGSLVFGRFDSNASSPVPRPGAGFPPPGIMPYPQTAMPVAAVDGYGRPVMVSPTLDGYPAAIMSHHGPPTPHSFHGSQSSIQAEDHGFGHYPPINGHNGYHVEPVAQTGINHLSLNPHMNGAMHSNAVSAPFQSVQEQGETLDFLRRGISDNTFNDCVIEAAFRDSPYFGDHPDYRALLPRVRTHGHRFVFSRSPALARVMKSQRTAPGGCIFLDVQDEFMRPDVFLYAIRSLYGWSLADIMLPTDLQLRNVKDDFKLAVSYAATAQFLELPRLYTIALQRASNLLHWETLDLAVDFALPNVTVPRLSRSDDFNVSGLVDRLLVFIVDSFPNDFVLDISAADNGFTRLPAAGPYHHSADAPTIAHGTSGAAYSRHPPNIDSRMHRNQLLSSNPRLSQIKFGDISPPNRNGYVPHDAPVGLEAVKGNMMPSPNDTILSRILLNLPFNLLTRVLEHPQLAKPSGELSIPARYAIMSSIVAERESRRLRTLDRGAPELRMFQDTLAKAADPLAVKHMGDFLVNNMGYKEEVFLGDPPCLVHRWVPTSSVGGSITA